MDLHAADPRDHFIALGFHTHQHEFGVHHAARGIFFELQQGGYFLGVIARQLVQQLAGSLRRKIGQQVGSFVWIHLLQDVAGLLGVEFFHHLGFEAVVELGQCFGRRFLVERFDDGVALAGGELFDDVRQVGRMDPLKLVAGDAQFDASQRIGLDKVNELPGKLGARQAPLQAADRRRRNHAL